MKDVVNPFCPLIIVLVVELSLNLISTPNEFVKSGSVDKFMNVYPAFLFFAGIFPQTSLRFVLCDISM